ncbi:MAG TPA: hypothetical protein PKW18_13120 [Candidatus Sumerlaeota bacterium]|nr:hypothetical protein [Candidatus Sumerlaeota bacterium]
MRKTKLHKTCIICGQTVSIITENPKEWSTNGIGRSNSGYLTMRIKDDLPQDSQRSTLLHEIIHLIADMNSLKPLLDDETSVAVLANCLFAWMRDNKDMVMDMIKRNSKGGA